MSGKPTTSSRDVYELLTALKLDVELDAGGPARLTEAVEQAFDWYADPERAAAAKVCSTGIEAAFTRWLGRPLPEGLSGDGLVMYVADTLLITADHSEHANDVPQLLALEGKTRTLYLLRANSARHAFRDEGWLPVTCNYPDTEAALGGIFRIDGCTRAYAEHAASCGRCLKALQKWDYENGLPEGFDALRTWPEPERPDDEVTLPPLPPASGVGIVIKKKG